MPYKTTLVAFADDLAIVACASDEAVLMNTVNLVIQRVVNWMEDNRLTVALYKTEAVLLTKKRKISPVNFYIQGAVIHPSKSLKYLGVWLDTKLNFSDHINKMITKAEKTLTALALLIPNVGGARASKRRVLASVVAVVCCTGMA